jgi:hypothetical protein
MAPYLWLYMDINKIFDLFDSSSKDELVQDRSAIVNDFKEHPAYWLGMYKKLIFNQKLFSQRIIYHLNKLDTDQDLEVVGNNLAFERGWHYIQKFNVNEEIHKDSIILLLDSILLKTLEDGIYHFQEKEEYERCAHLKKILDISKMFLE